MHQNKVVFSAFSVHYPKCLSGLNKTFGSFILYSHIFAFLAHVSGESMLIWYSGNEGKQLKLSNVSRIIHG